MYFSVPGAKDVLIKNLTGEELKDIYLTYEGLDKHHLRISGIGINSQVSKILLLNHLYRTTELRLFYYKNNEKCEIVVYNDLSRNDLRKLILEISKEDGKLKVQSSMEEK